MTGPTREPGADGLRFGLVLPQGWRLDLRDIPDPIEQAETMMGLARRAEAMGFDSVWLYDHFHTVPTAQLESTFECWSTMAALARETSRVQLGQMATCNGYRSPSLLAKMTSTIDVLSHGRLILGLGAGWYEQEHLAYGFDFGTEDDPPLEEGGLVTDNQGRRPGYRLNKLAESVQIILAMWTQDRATFEGQHYQVRGAINEPKGVQQPHIPLWIAGGGPRTLGMVARWGDGCNITHRDPEVIADRLAQLDGACRTQGRDPATITRSTIFNPVVGDADRQATVTADYARRSGTSVEWATERLWNRGTAAEIRDSWQRVVDLGVRHVLVYVPDILDDGALDRVMEDVILRIHA